MKDSRINIRISKEQHKALKKYAKKNGKSITLILEEFITGLLGKKDRSGKEGTKV